MKIFAISDFHGAIEVLDDLKKKVVEVKPNLIVFTGDVVKGYARGDEWLDAIAQKRTPDMTKESIKQEEEEDLKLYEEFYGNLNELNIPVVTIPGNMDAPEERFFSQVLNFTLYSDNIHVVQENLVKVKKYIVAGFGGEITESSKETFFVLQYPRREVEFGIRRVKFIKGTKILLFHTPPVGDVVDIEGNTHRGTLVVNDIIKDIKPALVFCGHAHKAKGYEMISDTLVINPGALKKGNFAIVDTEKMKVELMEL
jgi:Icc-related predicted phosphoesterase